MPEPIKLEQIQDPIALAALAILEGQHRTEIEHPAVALYVRRLLTEPDFCAAGEPVQYLTPEQLDGIRDAGFTVADNDGTINARSIWSSLRRSKAHPAGTPSLLRNIDEAVMRLATSVAYYRRNRSDSQSASGLATEIGEYAWHMRQSFVTEILRHTDTYSVPDA